jgi:putative glycerol-1-phosphate prenyltransferase
MMAEIYQTIVNAKARGEKLLAVLLDPDKLPLDGLPTLLDTLHENRVDILLVGGSTVETGHTQNLVRALKKITQIPVLIFPGDFTQISQEADGILFLSLLSGRNPEYLIEQQIKSVPLLMNSSLEVIPTGYILIDGGKETAVQRVSKTRPLLQENIKDIVHTACAGMYLGNKLIYLEAGSGAKKSVSPEIIKVVRENIQIPLIVGGGIRTQKQVNEAFQSGADIVVIGTAFEQNPLVLNKIKMKKNESIH